MRILNLTPHDVVVIGKSPITIPASGAVARVVDVSSPAISISGLPAVTVAYGAISGLPAAVAGTTYLVSGIVFDAAVRAGRSDVCAPVNLVRDDAGRVIGCRALRVPAIEAPVGRACRVCGEPTVARVVADMGGHETLASFYCPMCQHLEAV